MRRAAAALRSRNFAIFWSGALLSNTGTWIQNVTVPFVLFQLTHSAVWVGFASFVQFAPMVLVGPLGGSLADRYPRRTVLLVTQSVMAVLALGLSALWSAGAATPWAIVAVVAATGVVGGINIPSWQAFVSELVPRPLLLNAVTLNSAQFNAARALGPALGGLIIGALGPGWAFLVNGLSFAAVLVALALVRVPRLVERRPARPRVFVEFVDTVRYARSHVGIAICILVIVAVGLLGSPVFQLLVVFKDRVFGVGDAAYGLLGASLGIGSVLGAPVVAGWGGGMARSRLTIRALGVYGFALAAFGLAPSFWPGVAALVLAGAGYLAIASTLNTTVQLLVDERMRGKVLSLYIMGLTVSYPVGSLVQGWLAEQVGPRPTVVGAGTLLLLITGWFRFGSRLLVRMDDGEAGLETGDATGGSPRVAAAP